MAEGVDSGFKADWGVLGLYECAGDELFEVRWGFSAERFEVLRIEAGFSSEGIDLRSSPFEEGRSGLLG